MARTETLHRDLRSSDRPAFERGRNVEGRRNQDTEMYDLMKSDAVIVAVKQANNGPQRLAESVEQRAAAEENPEG